MVALNFNNNGSKYLRKAVKIILKNMIPFFDGLIPEGWLLEIAVENWKLNPRDRMNLLLTLCQDNIGDVSIKREIK
ncbi:MAG: HipA N-terminal domain-containing protein [Bacteroidetes bacterium]|nr:HipA N-terminal domain-containing protein [Bacteroidota bacterium]MBU1117084.1 HipA N-terminal domain-containing protein [Bacteroidota bacterium]MBU1798119.1 HipA N-terminal domain-containing protein [Bacteroidota bacterium]